MDSILISLLSGAVTGIVTIAVIKNDINWLKHILETHDGKITLLMNKGK